MIAFQGCADYHVDILDGRYDRSNNERNGLLIHFSHYYFFHIVHMFLSLDLRMILILLTMFARLTCLVYYIGC